MHKDCEEGEAPRPVVFSVFQTGNRANGGVTSITEVMVGLVRTRPIVITQLETEMTSHWRRQGLEVHVIRCSRTESSPIGRLKQLVLNHQSVRRIVRCSGARVAHCNDILAFEETGLGARVAGARLVLNVRNVKPHDKVYTVKWWFAAVLCDRVLVLSKEMESEVRERLLGRTFLRRREISHLYSAVRISSVCADEKGERAPLRSELDVGGRGVMLIYVAAFNETKGQLQFLKEASRELLARVPDSYLYFVGDFEVLSNPYAGACARFVAEAELEHRIHFVGYSESVNRWYDAADVTILASRREGLARCMIESIAMGTPVVSFAVCSAREILEQHVCGVVVPDGRYDRLVDAVASLIEDSDRRLAMGRSGEVVAQQLFDPVAVVAEYERLYAEVQRQ